MAFGTLPDHVRHQRFAAGAFPRRLRAWRERNNLSQSEAALKLQIPEANTARVGARSSCATRPCANRNRKNHSCLAHPHELLANVAIRESRIAPIRPTKHERGRPCSRSRKFDPEIFRSLDKSAG